MVEMSQTASGQIEEVSRKEFWEIVGLLLADDSVRVNRKHRKFEVVFAGKENALTQIFQERMKNLFKNLHFTKHTDKHQVKSFTSL
jgi:hypothetical protein